MRHPIRAFLILSSMAACAAPAGAQSANQLVYVALEQPCRLVDTRTAQGGSGPLAGGTLYVYGTSDAKVMSQNGNAAGCGIPAGIAAVSVSINMLNASGAGNIRAWSTDAGPTGPAAGTAVYNPTVATPAPGQTLYNGAAATIAVGSLGNFYFSVANGHIDMTLNAVGYWLPVSWSSSATGLHAVALGDATSAGGIYGTALGSNASNTPAGGGSPANFSFVYGDGSVPTQNTASYQFMVRASGGIVLYSGTDTQAGTQLAAGSGTWTVLSDRNAKQALQPIDALDVLDRVVAMPLSTWQYKTQDARYRHMGPMAQDFYTAFGLGESDTGIDTIDADGVALAAIQGLNARLEKTQRELALRDDKIAELEADAARKAQDVADLRRQVEQLATAIAHHAE